MILLTAATTTQAATSPQDTAAEEAQARLGALLSYADEGTATPPETLETTVFEIRVLQEQIATKPDSLKLWYELGNLLLRVNRPAKAAEAFWRVARANPDDSDAIGRFAAAILGTGDGESARKLYSALLENDPGNPRILFNYASACYKAGRLEEAEEVLTKLLEKHPGHANARYNLGMTLAELGNTEEAARQLELSYEAAPAKPFALLAAARLMAHEKKVERMFAYLEKAAPLVPPAMRSQMLGHPVFEPWSTSDRFLALFDVQLGLPEGSMP
jgi:superkiller protein 3